MTGPKVETLFPFTLTSTDVTMTLSHLWNCVESLQGMSSHALKTTLLTHADGTVHPAEDFLWGAIVELQRVIFKLNIGESEVA